MTAQPFAVLRISVPYFFSDFRIWLSRSLLQGIIIAHTGASVFTKYSGEP